jgi:small GTP-binding protein
MNKEEIIKMKIKRVEKEIRDTPYDKSSEHHHGVLKAKLARLEEELGGPAQRGSGGQGGYAIKHSGDASVVLVGLPNVGKSTLLNRVTNAESKVGNYDFTTLGVVPGMMEYKGVKIQLLDLPGIVEKASDNKGFGRKVISVIRAADMVVLMTDVQRVEWLERIEKELYLAGIRLGQAAPKIQVNRMAKGGIQVVDPFGGLDKKMVEEIAEEMGIDNAVIIFEEKIETVDKLIDGLSKTRKYMPVIRVINKVDETRPRTPSLDRVGAILISAEGNVGIEEFKEGVWRELGLVRVYLKKERSGEADYDEPLIMKQGQTLNEVLQRISNEMREDVNRALIWGKNARFPGQEVSFGFGVFDEMEVWFGR